MLFGLWLTKYREQDEVHNDRAEFRERLCARC